jgi:phosphoribosylglycinamide formyltransferase 1
MPLAPIRLAVLVSGSGTTLQNLIDQIAAEKLDAAINLVVGSRPGLAALDRAATAKLANFVVNRRGFESVADFSNAVFGLIDDSGIDLVCLGGWLSLLEIPEKYTGKIINIHPALLPSFGGKGMYGANVHQAVLDHGCKMSGCTVHFVDGEFDAGPIILQRACPVDEADTATTLAERVFEVEKIAYPEAIRLFQAGRLTINGRRVQIKD